MPPQKKNLLLCLDAFNTLFTPSIPIPIAYARTACAHGIPVPSPSNPRELSSSFKEQFKSQSARHPNYGRATGMGAQTWWKEVIHNTLSPFLKPGQQFPRGLVEELLKKYSSSEGYTLYGDVRPFFDSLKSNGGGEGWKYERVVVGVVTNSDDRVPGILESFGLKVGKRRVGAEEGVSKKEEEDGLIREAGTDAGREEDVNFVCLSYDVGFEKPDRRIFDAAVSMLPSECNINDFDKLYVGDELEKDYLGAKAAGWDSVLLKREWNEEGIRENGTKQAEVEDKEGNKGMVDMAGSLMDLRSWRS
jgi:FMN phosphatase YigB (HAD superfamily)